MWISSGGSDYKKAYRSSRPCLILHSDKKKKHTDISQVLTTTPNLFAQIRLPTLPLGTRPAKKKIQNPGDQDVVIKIRIDLFWASIDESNVGS